MHETKVIYIYNSIWQNYVFTLTYITLVDEISKTLDKGQVMTDVFLDLRKAFDTVNHNILLRKIYAYGIGVICIFG